MRYTIAASFIASMILAASPAAASESSASRGGDVGNGGDTVNCRPSAENALSGRYSLDYLLTMPGDARPLVEAASWQHSLFEIRRVLARALPELLPGFDEFQQNVLNSDYSRPQVWEKAEFGLVSVDDESLGSASRVPDNCRRADGRVELSQAVIRQFKDRSGSDRVVYRYAPEVFESLGSERPLQLSFLLVHEWLWSVSDNVDRNRRLARFFHTADFFRLGREELLAQLRGIGLAVLQAPKVVAVDGTGDFVTLDEALARSPRGTTLHLKEGRYVTHGAVIDKSFRLIGAGDRSKVVIESAGFAPALTIQCGPDDEVLVSNVSFARADSGSQRGVWLEALAVRSGSPLIEGSVFGGESKGTRMGLLVFDGAAPTVRRNEFIGMRRGIVLLDYAAGTYEGNSYRGNNYDIESFSVRSPALREAPGTRLLDRSTGP